MAFFVVFILSTLNCWSQVDVGQGSFFLREQQFGKAKRWYQDQLKKSPKDVACMIGLGDAYLALNQVDSAKIAFRQAVDLDPVNPFALAGLGKTALQNSDQQAESDYFDRARRADKMNPEVYCNIAEGCIHFTRKDTMTALIFLNQGLAISPKYAGLHLSTGNLETLKKNWGLAANAFERAVFFDPKSAVAYRNLGYAYTISRAYRDARSALEKSVAIQPGQILAYKYLGDLFYATANYEEGEKAYRTYLAQAEVTADDRERFALLLFFNKKYKDAADLLEEMQAIKGDASILLRIRGYIAYETGDIQKARQYMEQFFAMAQPAKVIFTDHHYYAQILEKCGRELQAMDSYRKGLELDPSKTGLYGDLARLSAKNGLHGEAAGYYKKMADLGLNRVVNAFQTGKEYYFEGENWKVRYDSLKQKLKLVNHQASDSITMKQRMNFYYSMADSAFTVVTRLSPEYAGGYIWKGRMQSLLYPEAENAGARDAYEKALEILVKGDQAKNGKSMIECYRYLGSWYWLGYEKYSGSDKQKAAGMKYNSTEYFKKILEIDPTDSQAKAVIQKMKEIKQ